MQEADRELYWDATYAIAAALLAANPDVHPETIGLEQLHQLVLCLPGFVDDPVLATERILMDIQIAWFEEARE
jgi:FeS assembly protein IscX